MTAQDALARPQAAKLTVEDFLLLDRSGAFAAYAKSELIDGTVFVVNAIYSEHFKAKDRLYRRIADACDALGRGIEAWSDGSISIPPNSCPQPDIFLTGVEPDRGLVRLDTVLLAVEVASSSLGFDLGEKLRLYVAAGIPEYWLVDVEKRVIHQMWAPQGTGYAERREIGLGERIEAATIPGLALETEGVA